MATSRPFTYRVLSYGDQLGYGVAGSRRAQVSVVAKCNKAIVPYCVPNELICAEIGRLMRLPIPPSGLIEGLGDGEKNWFASFDFNLVGEDLPPIDPEECVKANLDLCSGITLFDVFIANEDRSVFNISHDTENGRITIFDHTHALFGAIARQGEARLESLAKTTRLGQLDMKEHCLIRHLTSDRFFEKWIGRIENLADDILEEICLESIGLGVTTDEANMAVMYFKERRNNFTKIIRHNAALFRRIDKWSLFP